MKKVISLIILTLLVVYSVSAQNVDDSRKNDSKVLFTDKNLKVYPNPVRQGSLLYIQRLFNKGEQIDIYLLDINGVVLIYLPGIQVDNQNLAIRTDNISSGVYILYLRVGNKVNWEKIIITN